jgi:hypothetical protein
MPSLAPHTLESWFFVPCHKAGPPIVEQIEAPLESASATTGWRQLMASQ